MKFEFKELICKNCHRYFDKERIHTGVSKMIYRKLSKRLSMELETQKIAFDLTCEILAKLGNENKEELKKHFLEISEKFLTTIKNYDRLYMSDSFK